MSSSWTYRTIKRCVDIGAAGVGLGLSWPVIVVGAVAVKLDSPGPALYRSQRVGRGGKPFSLLKLRTMAENRGGAAPLVTAGNDMRITRVGRWLRRTKLDELPQLWNVLVGDVSVVGPRPEVERYVRRFETEYDEILRVRPGLTDRATLSMLDEESVLADTADPESYYLREVLPKKIGHYLKYVRNPSLLEDARILGATAGQLAMRILETAAELVENRSESTGG